MGLGKPIDEITREEKEEYLTWSDYGRCAYNSGGDINDRQTVNVEFENGSIASFTMVGGTCRAGRDIHIIGTKGEIQGSLESGKFTLRIFDRGPGKFTYNEEEIDVAAEVHAGSDGHGGHSGGDYAIMHEVVRYFNGDMSSVSITTIDDSVSSHLVVYAADTSVKSGVSEKI